MPTSVNPNARGQDRGAQAKITLPPIDAYGDGGFRIGGVRYDGPTLMVEDQVAAWPVNDLQSLSLADFDRFLQAEKKPDLVILGVGPSIAHPPQGVREGFLAAGIGLEVLDSATACRVYNMLAGEARRIGVALLPAD
ncbi:Mth938-like domain-containing protein [Woodsholea maritima]|uniref:Mth938-like domain-containing protein n=1 Tax=Woodsholea maritima TaxID=240237 RepID=UPI00035F1633|nr:Mth938-like domain-containing protein [Woodsholea maritima]